MNKEDLKILYIVIPCYNEEEVLPITTEELTKKMNALVNVKISAKSRVLYVDNGSEDRTWEIIKQIHENNELFSCIKVAKNKGYQSGVLAGLMTAKEYADMTISMDADLQDDVNVIDSMLEEYYQGSQIVYGVRGSRKKDSFLKRFTAESYYKFLDFMGVEIVFNHGDCRLMSSVALDALEEYSEVNLFLRGIIPQLGFKTSSVYYERKERAAGESKYPVKELFRFAIEGITSFSVRPLKLITTFGFMISILSFLVLIYALIVKLIGNVVSGWTFIVVSIWLVAGIQMLSLGIIGEYIGKIYKETKRRPRYIIEKELL